ncbi:uncharacterized protein UU044-like [Palaemon carinicauda]|uniref:uncharacterized protein UU044-like n=1 Tax=Palaemon carinicauda TaxID=392227 RepID=UPI0035B5AA6D
MHVRQGPCESFSNEGRSSTWLGGCQLNDNVQPRTINSCSHTLPPPGPVFNWPESSALSCTEQAEPFCHRHLEVQEAYRPPLRSGIPPPEGCTLPQAWFLPKAYSIPEAYTPPEVYHSSLRAVPLPKPRSSPLPRDIPLLKPSPPLEGYRPPEDSTPPEASSPTHSPLFAKRCCGMDLVDQP